MCLPLSPPFVASVAVVTDRIDYKLRFYVCVDPQAREVVGEGVDLDGLWTAYSINKEDIGVTFAPTRVLRSVSSGPG